MAKIPLQPAHPERICWGCDEYCQSADLACGNGTIRTPHPIELFGPGWQEHESIEGSADARDPSQDLTADEAVRVRALTVLRGVVDPELGVNVVDLGLVCAVRVREAEIDVDLTMTSPSCPLGEYLVWDATERLETALRPRSVQVKLVWDRPWSFERVSKAGRLALGWDP